MTDWSTVPVDTEIWVRQSVNAPWVQRYFALFNKGRVYTWINRHTSQDKVGITDWDEACLSTPDDVTE